MTGMPFARMWRLGEKDSRRGEDGVLAVAQANTVKMASTARAPRPTEGIGAKGTTAACDGRGPGRTQAAGQIAICRERLAGHIADRPGRDRIAKDRRTKLFWRAGRGTLLPYPHARCR